MPDYDEAGQLVTGPNGWYLPDGMAQSHRPMASVHAQRALSFVHSGVSWLVYRGVCIGRAREQCDLGLTSGQVSDALE